MEICLDLPKERSITSRRAHAANVEPLWEPPLRIWHIGASSSPRSVNGVNTVIWMLASSQRSLGHRVHIPLLELPIESNSNDSNPSRSMADGIHRHVLPATKLRFHRERLRELLTAHPPDVVHIHSAFIPRHTLLGRLLESEGIPYVLTPHGALLPQVLERNRPKKAIYSRLLERTFVRKAAAVTGLTDAELRSIHHYAGRPLSNAHVIFNPIDVDNVAGTAWNYRGGRPSLLFLGRFDVEVKGLDRLVEIAKFLPEADFHLYGRAQDRRGRALPRTAPGNMYFHGPVFGRAKAAVFANATLYVQPSRWEAFPLSATEAMALGVPCAMSENLHLAEMLSEDDSVLAIPAQPEAAAVLIRNVLTDRERLNNLSRLGQEFVRSNCSPRAVARQYLAVYRDALLPPKKTDLT